MALIDTIQRNLATTSTEPVAATDQTGRARKLLGARSGKALTSGASAPQSAIGEAAANDATAQELQPVQDAARMASAGVTQSQQQLASQETGARADLALREKSTQQQNALRKQQLFGEAAREGRKLDLEKDGAKLEEMAHTLRLGDKRYMDRLELEGSRKRLDDELAFKEELQRSIYGSNTDLLKQILGDKDILQMNDREFTNAMANIDMDSAILMASNAAKDAKAAGNITALGAIATGATGAAGTYADRQPAATTPTTTAAAPAAAAPSSTLMGPPTIANDPGYWKY